MDLQLWAKNKRVQLATMPPPDVSRVTPSIHDLFTYVSGQRAEPAIIAEYKHADPFTGWSGMPPPLRRFIEAVMELDGGALAACTDASLFGGSITDLNAMAGSGVPVIMHDMVVDRSQIFDARLAGADAITLYAAVLDAGQMSDLLAVARDLHMVAIAMVENGATAQKALSSGARMLALNPRGPTGHLDCDQALEMARVIQPPTALLIWAELEKAAVGERFKHRVDALVVGQLLLESRNLARTFDELRAANAYA